MARKKKQKMFQFPDKLLEQVNECTKNGFVMFSFDNEGNPQVFAMCDDSLASMALQNHIKNWITAVDAVNVQLTAQNLIKNG